MISQQPIKRRQHYNSHHSSKSHLGERSLTENRTAHKKVDFKFFSSILALFFPVLLLLGDLGHFTHCWLSENSTYTKIILPELERMKVASVVLRFALFAVTSAHATGQGVAFSCNVESYSDESKVPPCQPNYVIHADSNELACDAFYSTITYTKCDFGDKYMKDGIFTAPSSGIYVFNLDARMEIFRKEGRKILNWIQKEEAVTLWGTTTVPHWEHHLYLQMVKSPAGQNTVEVIDFTTMIFVCGC